MIVIAKESVIGNGTATRKEIGKASEIGTLQHRLEIVISGSETEIGREIVIGTVIVIDTFGTGIETKVDRAGCDNHI